MQRAAAVELAQQVLIWLAAHDDLLPVFLGASGSDPAAIRAGARDPDFLGSVLDFLLLDDAWIIAFCEARGHPPEAIGRARAALPGGDLVHWT